MHFHVPWGFHEPDSMFGRSGRSTFRVTYSNICPMTVTKANDLPIKLDEIQKTKFRRNFYNQHDEHREFIKKKYKKVGLPSVPLGYIFIFFTLIRCFFSFSFINWISRIIYVEPIIVFCISIFCESWFCIFTFELMS